MDRKMIVLDQKSLQHFRSPIGRDESLPRIVRFAFGAFMVPPLVFGLSWGNDALYRAAQIGEICLLLVAVLCCLDRVSRPSVAAVVISAVLSLGTLTSVASAALTDSILDVNIIIKTATIVAMIHLMDCLRRYSFPAFAESAIPAIWAIIILTAINFAVDPVIVWGRYTFFGLHPNLGGEILFCCAALLGFSKFPLLRWVGGGCLIYFQFLLQSRAALLATIVVVLGLELRRLWLRSKGEGTSLLLPILAGGIILLLTILISPEWVAPLFQFFSHDVLLLDSNDRGLGTGWVGRDETWAAALSSLFEHPVFGAGMDNISSTQSGELVHTGYIVCLGEFGLMSIFLFVILISAAVRWGKLRGDILIILIACHIVYLFSARSINLNVFPMVMWLLCLPWRPWPERPVQGLVPAFGFGAYRVPGWRQLSTESER